MTRLDRPAQFDIQIVSEDGGRTWPVTAGAATDWNPIWAPDGRHLYFASDRGGVRGAMNLWRIAIDAGSGNPLGEPQPITTPTAYIAHLSISADGRRLAYSSVLQAANIQRLRLDAAAGAVQEETHWLTTGSRSWSSPDPSPDGGLVTFYSRLQPEGHLYVIRSDGTGLRQLTGDAAIDRVPRWSPDGRWILFFRIEAERWNCGRSSPTEATCANSRKAASAAIHSGRPMGCALQRRLWCRRAQPRARCSSIRIAHGGNRHRRGCPR
jgi:Tol biopolymer transport system component